MRTIMLILAAASLLLTACDNLFYYPSRQIYTTDPGMPFEDISIPSASGHAVHGWYFPVPNPKGLVVFFHGNARNLTAQYRGFAWVTKAGYDYMIFDYSGYGRTRGKANRRAVHLDGIAALTWAVAKKKERGYPLILIGQSLGGAVLSASLIDHPERAEADFILLDCTFASYKSVAAYHFSGGHRLVSDDYAAKGRLATLDGIPKLITHCRQDETVPFFLGEELYAEAGEPKWFWEFDCGHSKAFWRKEAQDRFLAFAGKEISRRKR